MFENARRYWLKRRQSSSQLDEISRRRRALKLETLESRLAPATWSGDVFDTTPGTPLWTNAQVQEITGNVHVPAGKTLTIQPGTVIQFDYGDFRLTVDGTLNAAGTAAAPIIFTSVYDNSPTGGSDGAGNGYWGSIKFEPTSTGNVMDHTEVRYGGWSLDAVVDTAAPLTIANSVIRNSYHHGLRIVGANPTLTADTFRNNLGSAISMDLASQPNITNVSASNNALNGVRLDSGTLPDNTSWESPGLPYQLSGDVTVPAGKTLTVGAGQVIKAYATNLVVNGTLTAMGAALSPIIFTSYRDDAAGGDTNGNGDSAGSAGDWGAITFGSGSSGNLMDHTEVRYGGFSGGILAAAIIDNGPLTLTNSVVRDTYQTAGLRIVGSAPTLRGNAFRNNGGAAISMDLAAHPAISNVTLSNNAVNGAQLDSGTLPGDTTWNNPDIVYLLTDEVTVPTGTTLTAAAGQIIKFAVTANGVSLFVNGTLHAAGSAESPVVFTSGRDATAGGNTDNYPYPGRGDWNAIQFSSDSSGNVMDHTEVRYGGFYGGILAHGAIMNAGVLTLSNSIVRESRTNGVFVSPSASAMLTSNVVVRNGIAGVQAQADSTLTAINNTIDGNGGLDGGFGYGFLLDSSTATLTNNLITNNSSVSDGAGILQTGANNLTMSFNDVFNPGRPNYSGLADQTGTNGNVSVDPKYFNRATLSYQLRPGSPVEDAGTSGGAPLTDFFGNPRFDDPNIAGRGDGSGTDMGASEVQEVATSTIDLATLNVSGPTTGTQGMNATVNWTVKNIGTGAATGSWSDAIYLSDTPAWTPAAKFLKRVTHTGDLGPGQSYDASTSVTLSNVLPGNHYFVVRTNDVQEVFEGLAIANNAGVAPAPISFAVPALTLNTPFNDQFSGAGQSNYYQITVTGGQTLSFSLQSSGGSGATELYVSRGTIPSRSEFDYSGGGSLSPNQQFVLPTTQQGTYYVLAYAAYGSAASSAFTLTAGQPVFGVQSLSPATVGNSGRVTLTIGGALFTSDSQASLIAPDNSTIAALENRFVDATHLQATFNLSGKATGKYDVRVVQGVQTATAADALTVNTGAAGHLKVDFIVPGSVRAGFQGTVTVEYTNDGDADLPAPILDVTSNTSTLRFTGDANPRGNTAEFLAINPTGDAGVLPPGAHGSINLNFVAMTDGSSNSLQFTLTSQSSQANTTPLDWTAAKEMLRPSNVPADAWNAIYTNFMDDVGTTLGSLQTLLDRQATYLSRLDEYTGDEGRLMALEFQDAGNFGAIVQRYSLGAFGRGIPDPTAVSVTADSSGNVAILAGGKTRTFLIQSNHTYRGANGDLGLLTLQNGAYRLQEPDGTIIAFLADGRLDYRQDTNGNRLTANYTSGRLTSYTDNFGDMVTFSYNAQGRISRITDAVGRQTNYAYDAVGEHLLTVSDAHGTTQFSYITGQGPQREHAVQSITYPDGTHTFFTYDARGRLVKSTRDGGANELNYSYDGGGVTVTDGLNHSNTTLMNEFGQLALAEDALGNATRYLYDGNHSLIQVVQPDGSAMSITPDNRNNPATTVNPLGQRVDAAFDPAFNTLQSLRDARGNVLSFGSDAHGNPLSLTYPDGSLERFTYDSAGNIIKKVDQVGNETRFTYDAHNLLTREDFADGTHADFVYDIHRNLSTATNDVGTTTYSYDPTTDYLSQVTYPDGHYLKFNYDAAGRRTQSLDQDGFKVKYSYDSLGRLAGLTDGNDAPIVSYSYDSVGRLQRQDMGNSTFATYVYDANSRIASLINHAPGGAALSQFDYTYDARGRTLTMTTTAGITSYGYDALGQLTSVNLPEGRTITYQYDAAGNRVSVTDNGTTTTYSTNNMNQYTSVGSSQLSYDANGNLVMRIDPSGTTSYSYNLLGQLASVATPTDKFDYVYDAVGNRIAEVRNGTRTGYLVDPIGFRNTVAEYGANGQLVAHFTHGAGLASRIDSTGNAAYYGFDASGNTVNVTGSNGSESNRYSYLPFGDTLAATESIQNPFTFGGQLGVMSDGNSLYYMRARYYDASAGRFTTMDPIGVAGGLNRYRYAENDPITNTDPSGLILGIDIATITLLVEQAIAVGNADAVNQLYVNVLKEVVIINESGQQVGGALNVRKIIQGLQALTKATPLGTAAEATVTAGETVAGGTVVSTTTTTTTTFILESEAAAGGYSTTVGVSASQGVGASASSGFVAAEGVAGVVVAEVVAPAVAVGAPGIIGLYALKETADQLLPTETQAGSKLLAKCQELGFSTAGGACVATLRELRAKQQSKSLAPVDPNDISGPLGFGTQHFVTADQTFPYTILFENTPTATAPALVVKVTQQLDSNLDWTTFELGDFGFGKYTVHVPAGRRFYSTRVDASGTVGEFVDVTADFNPSTGLATWTFTSVDPKSGSLPQGATDGFLLPDDSTGSGEGFVNYRIQPKAGLATGTNIDAQATVFFDAGLPDESSLDTPQFTNKIDAAPPASSHILALPATSPPTFPVSWTGTDDANGSGIATYDIYVSTDGGAFLLWLDDVSSTSAEFNGTVGHAYAFYSVATDNVGKQQNVSPAAQASTTVSDSPPNDPPTVTITGPNTSVPGLPLKFTFEAHDSSTADLAASFTYVVNWGDGKTDTLTGPNVLKTEHAYLKIGTFSVKVLASDQHNAFGPIASNAVAVSTVMTQGSVVYVGGGTAGEKITVFPANVRGNTGTRVMVKVNSKTYGPYNPSEIVVFGNSGNDILSAANAKVGSKTVRPKVALRLFGGDGNDELNVSANLAANVLVGGSGNDRLTGSASRDIVLGGIGSDVLHGGSQDDILVAGRTAFDSDLASLDQMLAIWTSTATYKTRVNRLFLPTPAGTKLSRVTTFNDSIVDSLFGDAGSDWFLATTTGPAAKRDRLSKVAGEAVAQQG